MQQSSSILLIKLKDNKDFNFKVSAPRKCNFLYIIYKIYLYDIKERIFFFFRFFSWISKHHHSICFVRLLIIHYSILRRKLHIYIEAIYLSIYLSIYDDVWFICNNGINIENLHYYYYYIIILLLVLSLFFPYLFFHTFFIL